MAPAKHWQKKKKKWKKLQIASWWFVPHPKTRRWLLFMLFLWFVSCARRCVSFAHVSTISTSHVERGRVVCRRHIKRDQALTVNSSHYIRHNYFSSCDDLPIITSLSEMGICWPPLCCESSNPISPYVIPSSQKNAFCRHQNHISRLDWTQQPQHTEFCCIRKLERRVRDFLMDFKLFDLVRFGSLTHSLATLCSLYVKGTPSLYVRVEWTQFRLKVFFLMK